MSLASKITSVYAAAEAFRRYVLDKEGLRSSAPKQVTPYCLQVLTADWLRNPDTIGNFFVFLKREWFNTFGQQFPQVRAEFGMSGMTITLSALTHAVKVPNAYIVIVMEEGQIYWLPAKQWYEFVMLHDTKRVASNSRDGELEASVPASLLKNLH